MKKTLAFGAIISFMTVLLCAGVMNIASFLNGQAMGHMMSLGEDMSITQSMMDHGFCGTCVAMIELWTLEKLIIFSSLVLLFFVVCLPVFFLLPSFRDSLLQTGIDPPRRFDPLRSFLYQYRFVVILE